MDYSQFLAMKQEIGVLIVFLLVFLYDTFMPRKGQAVLPLVATVLFGCFTALCFVTPWPDTIDAFAGMYTSSTVIVAIKNILNVGVLIVLIQSMKWANSETLRHVSDDFRPPLPPLRNRS